MSYQHIKLPDNGNTIEVRDDRLIVPDTPIIPFIEGDGIGADITYAMKLVLNDAVKKTFGGKKSIAWMEIYAGEKAKKLYGEYLPEETIEAMKQFKVSIKGPLTTPVGGGFRSLNVSIRQILDLYACIRPVRYYRGTPSPLKNPELLNIVIFRENTEDVYAGIEWEKGSTEAEKVIQFLNTNFECNIRQDSGIGIKPMSEFATKRLMRKAIRFALDNGRKTITLVHKGNIMKYTEGAFKHWAYELALEEFRNSVVTEQELREKYEGTLPVDKIIVNDRIADSMFQQILLRPESYDLLVLPNLNGDYLSDAAAAMVGGLGMAPGSNIGDNIAVFEATHGSAPKYAGQDKVNPGSLILSGALMLRYLGWGEAADRIEAALEKTIESKVVTYDLARQIEGATEVSTSHFAETICQNM